MSQTAATSHQPSKSRKEKLSPCHLLQWIRSIILSVDASIKSSLSSQDGGFSEGQQIQSVGRHCSNVAFNVFSPHNSETINLFAKTWKFHAIHTTAGYPCSSLTVLAQLAFSLLTVIQDVDAIVTQIVSPHHWNLLVFAAFSLYDFKSDVTKQSCSLHLYHYNLHPSCWSDCLSRIFAG